ncbi:MAG: hypothetical protein AAGD96_22125, partial [Chloroflexota bacterium]
LVFDLPIKLFGARLTLDWAEKFWRPDLPANSIVPLTLINRPIANLGEFSDQLSQRFEQVQEKKTTGRMVDDALNESLWLESYSDRQKRRLYKSTFGLSRKEMQKIYNIHQFLDQSCDFSEQNPHIIDHVNSDHFYDQPHLNRAFRESTGFTLLEYFEANTILQDNLLAVSYNENTDWLAKL